MTLPTGPHPMTKLRARAIEKDDGMTMIERVARAIAAKETGSETNYRDFVDAARAAIEAMREPTDEMVRAGRAVDGQYNTVRASIDAAAHYRAMIDKALEKDMER